MTGSTRNTTPDAAIIQRIETLVEALSNRESLLAAARSQIDDFQQRIERTIDTRISNLEVDTRSSLATEIKTTSDYTKDLYARFERMVWIGLVALTGVSFFVGYQTFSSIPDKVSAEIGKITTEHKSNVDKILNDHKIKMDTTFAEMDNSISKHKQDNDNRLDRLVSVQESQLKQRLDEIDRRNRETDLQLGTLVNESNRKAAEKIEQIGASYDQQLRNFQVDWLVKLLRGESSDSDIVRQLAQSFESTGPLQRSQIALTLRDSEIPPNVLPSFKSAVEAWSPDTEVAKVSRYQILIRANSASAREDFEREFSKAVQDKNADRVIELTRIIWRVFGGGSQVRPTQLGSRPTIDAPKEIAVQYLPILRTALTRNTELQVLPMVFDIIAHTDAHIGDVDIALAKALDDLTTDPNLTRTLITAMPQLGNDPALFKSVIGFLQRNSDTLNTNSRDRIGASPAGLRLLQYGQRVLPSIGNNSGYAKAATDLIVALLGKPAGLDETRFRNYVLSGNIFERGQRFALSDDGNSRAIMLIQDNDSDWTEVPFKAKEIDLGSGLAVKITKMRVDGSDKADVNLGIELDVEIAGNTRRTIRFVGSERFSVIFQPERHVIESNKEASRVKVAFALEMISQRVSVMVSRFEEK